MQASPLRRGQDGRRAGGETHHPLFLNPLISLVPNSRFERSTCKSASFAHRICRLDFGVFENAAFLRGREARRIVSSGSEGCGHLR
jgi:hypothetical protein